MFQSTHSRGVRRSNPKSSAALPCFNPRTHEECDCIKLDDKQHSKTVSIHALTRSATRRFLSHSRLLTVSIHALTRSATCCYLLRFCGYVSFNPRTHEECDAILGQLTGDYLFQSTHSRGVRLGCQGSRRRTL